MENKETTGEDILARFSSKVLDEKQGEMSENFATELRQLAIDNVFDRIWSRPGLDARSRSLLTIGMLIALRATDELKIHTIIAVKNGLTVKELEEIIYHSSAYAGFPAATAAATAATDALRKQGLID